MVETSQPAKDIVSKLALAGDLKCKDPQSVLN